MYTLQGKTRQHATRFSHSVHIWSKTIRISCGPHITTFHTIVNNDRQSHCSREKGLLTQCPAWWLIDPWVHTQFLSQASHWSGGGKATLCWQQITRLIGHINTSIRSVRSILAHGGQPIGPLLTQARATTLNVLVFHIPLPDLLNRWSSLFT
jgi:hypothetical protein